MTEINPINNPVSYHIHNGIDSPQIDYNDLILPAAGVSPEKSVDLERDDTDYLLITDANQTGLDLSEDFTFEAWIKAEVVSTTTTPYILSKFNNGGERSYSFFITATTDAGILSMQVSDDGTTDDTHYQEYQTDNQEIFAGVWTHVAVTWDMSAETCIFYINGVAVASTKTTGSTIGANLFNSSVPFIIGGRLSGGNINQTFDGLIDDVRVWNVVRGAADILANYETTLAGNEAGLVGYWKMDGDYLDSTTNNNDLTEGFSPIFSSDFHGD